MKNLLTRSLTGLIYLIVFTGALFVGKYTFGILFLVINILALWEFYQLAGNSGHTSGKILGIITGSILFATAFYVCAFENSPLFLTLIVPLLIIIVVAELYIKNDTPLINISVTIFGILYVSVPLSLFNHFAFFEHGGYSYQIVLGFFILLWTNDTSAYLTGITLGRHKLFERISPKKSWEGFIGGTLITLVLAYFLNQWLNQLSLANWLVIGLIISVVGVYGDLVESMFKRTANIKDSGKILPGHGGMLDRIDSVLLSSPLVFTYLLIFKP